VAAHERGMNRTVYKLLKGYLRRSAWLYAFLGLLQFLMTGFYWMRGYDRTPAVGVLLGIWGAVAALNHRSLVWRSLPLTPQDASVFRWWAAAGAPGIFLTLVTGVAWASQRSSGFPTPDAAVIFESIVAMWALLGVVAALSRSAPWPAKLRSAKNMAIRIIVAASCFAALPAYGLPVGPAVRPYSILFFAVGIILLFVSAARARGGMDWHWPDPANREPRSGGNRGVLWPTGRYGPTAILIPLAQRTAVFAIVATVIVVSLQRIFPHARTALVWIYFIGISSAGFLLTFQVRRAIQPLRCLPLSAKQLAGLLLLFGALPGLATLGLTLLVSLAVLNARLDILEVTTFAFVIISTQALPLEIPARQNRFFTYWQPLVQRILPPAYIGWMAVYASMPAGRALWMRLPSVHWALQAFGVGLCIAGYFILVQQLRSGIRPSSSENAFSPG
jgi:hypothetical protein